MTLTPLSLTPQGLIGFRDNGNNYSKCNTFHAEYLIIDPKLVSEAWKEMGFFNLRRGFSLNLTQGTSVKKNGEKENYSSEYIAQASNYGIAGKITITDTIKWWNKLRTMPL